MVEFAGKDRYQWAAIAPEEEEVRRRLAPGKQTEVGRVYGAFAQHHAMGELDGTVIQRAVAPGVAMPGPALPDASAILRLFGRHDGSPVQATGPESASSASASTGGGAPLPAPLAAQMGAAFSTSFAGVRVHQDASAAALGATAYARGDDLHFAPGRYDPHSQAGRELIGHELTHVVQQRAGRVGVQGKGLPINADPALEAEADDLGARAARGQMVMVAGASAMPAATPAGAPLQLKLSDARVLLHQLIASDDIDDGAAEQLRSIVKKLAESELFALQQYARTLPRGPHIFSKLTGIQDPGGPEQVTQPSNPQRTKFGREADVSGALQSKEAWSVDWVIDELIFEIGRVKKLPEQVTEGLVDWLLRASPQDFDRVVLAASAKFDLDYLWEALAGADGPELGRKLLSSRGTKGGEPPGKKLREKLHQKVVETDDVNVLIGLFAQRFLIPSVTGTWDAPRLKKLYFTLEQLPDNHTLGNLALLEARGKDGISRGEYARQGIEIQHPPDAPDERDLRFGQRDGGPTSDVARNWGAEPIAFEGKDRFNEVVRHEVGHAIDAGGVYSDPYCTTLDGGHWKFHNDDEELGRAAFGYSGGELAQDPAYQDDQVMSGLGGALRSARGDGAYDRFQPALESYVKRAFPAPPTQTTTQSPPQEPSGGMFSSLLSYFSSDTEKAPQLPPKPKQPGLTDKQRRELTRLTITVGNDPAASLLHRHLAGEVYPGEAAVVNGRAFVDLSQLGHGPGRTASYDFSARLRQVSDYQFVSPSEWFAEAYTAYYEPVDEKTEVRGERLRERDPATWRFFAGKVDLDK